MKVGEGPVIPARSLAMLDLPAVKGFDGGSWSAVEPEKDGDRRAYYKAADKGVMGVDFIDCNAPKLKEFVSKAPDDRGAFQACFQPATSKLGEYPMIATADNWRTIRVGHLTITATVADMAKDKLKAADVEAWLQSLDLAAISKLTFLRRCPRQPYIPAAACSTGSPLSGHPSEFAPRRAVRSAYDRSPPLLADSYDGIEDLICAPLFRAAGGRVSEHVPAARHKDRRAHHFCGTTERNRLHPIGKQIPHRDRLLARRVPIMDKCSTPSRRCRSSPKKRFRRLVGSSKRHWR